MTQLPEAYERDPGLAAERTQLAWGRSTLALFGCGAAIAKGLPNVTGMPGRPYAGLALCAFGAVAWLSGVPYARARAHPERVRPVARRRAIAALALGTVAVGIGAVLIDTLLAP